jgi:hypothetical protein
MAVHRSKIFIKQNYKFHRKFNYITIHKHYFDLHAKVRSAAVTALLLVVGVGVKRRLIGGEALCM